MWAAVTAAVAVTLLAGAAGVAWARQQAALEAASARQRAVLEAQVGEALQQAAGYQEQGKLLEALAAVGQAEAMVNAVAADEGLRDRVRRRRAELEMAAKVEDIRLTDVAFGNYGDSVAVGPMKHPLYAQAFWGYGIHVLSADPEEAGGRIRATGIAVELRAALDDWAWAIRKNPELRGDLAWKHLLEAARAADPDDWRNQVRGALMSEPPDLPTLKRLAGSAGAGDQPPANLVLLGIALRESGAVEEAAALLRMAQQQHPGDFWINEELATTFGDPRRRQWNEELRFATAASALRPEMKSGYSRLARALVHTGAVDEAFIAFKKSRSDTTGLSTGTDESGINYSPATPESGAIHDFGCLLDLEGRRDDAIAAFRKAIQIKPDFEPEHTYLACFLENKGLLDDAITEYRKPVELQPDDIGARVELGYQLKRLGRLDDALAEYRKAVELKPDDIGADMDLGDALGKVGRLDEAIAERQRVVRLADDFAKAHHDQHMVEITRRGSYVLSYFVVLSHNDLGVALQEKGRLDEAIGEFRESIQLDRDFGPAHNNLGIAFALKCQWDEAIAEFRKAVKIKPDGLLALETNRSALNNIRNALDLAERDALLPAILRGEAAPADAAQKVRFADFCQRYKRLNATASRFYEEAFAARPELAGDVTSGNRYNAACAAALAGCGRGDDAPAADADRAHLRAQRWGGCDPTWGPRRRKPAAYFLG